MATNSRAKGAAGEREAAKFLRELGFTARRGQQFSGLGDSPDVVVEDLPNVWIECKLRSDIGIHSQSLKNAMEQAISDSNGTDAVPVVMWRKTGNRNWALTFTDWGWLTTVADPDGIGYWLRHLNDSEGKESKR